MNPVERVQAVLNGQRPDRPPVCFWCHFPPEQVSGRAAVRAHLDHLESFDLDFLKVMNDNGYPAGRNAEPVERVADLAALRPLHGAEPEFARQLDLLADLRRELRGRVLMTTTLFNAWAVLRQLIRPPKVHRPPNLDVASDEPSRRIRAFLAEDETAVREALRRIARNLAVFSTRCLEAGADGIFLSVRDDWLDGVPGPATAAWANSVEVEIVEAETPHGTDSLYAELVRPTDLEILAGAARGRFNVLHVCGRPVDFAAFARYPVHALNWADRAAGPSISAAAALLGEIRPELPAGQAPPVLCAGVDNLHTLPDGRPEDCAREVYDALHQAGDRPFIVAPGCTYDPQRVARENLDAVVRAAHEASYSAAAFT